MPLYARPPVRPSFAALLGALLCLPLLLAACGGDTPAPLPAGKADAKAGAQPATPGGAVPARVMAVSPQRVPIRLESVGQIEGSREVEVRARVGGIVQKRLYTEGGVVKAGEALFQIDPAPFEIALSQARAQLAQERARNEQTRREAGRLKELAAQKAISQREYDDANSASVVEHSAPKAAWSPSPTACSPP
jgi:membrane fusion protein (multidrug efflux system)